MTVLQLPASLKDTSVLALIIASAGIGLTYVILRAVYLVKLHPLANIPGPWWAACSRIPYARNIINGTPVKYIQALHDRYGPVVRYSPNEVSVITGDSIWQEIYGFRTGKQKSSSEYSKDPIWYPPSAGGAPSLVSAPEGDHGRQRRVLSHAFSASSLRDQEWVLQKYSDLLVSRIKETDLQTLPAVDLVRWYNFVTFDVIADLMFGEPFGCLAGAVYNEHVDLLLGNIHASSLFYVLRCYPVLAKVRSWFVTTESLVKRQKWVAFLRASVKARIESVTDRKDFMTAILDKQVSEEDGRGITEAEIVSNANALVIAGTETSATVLAAVTYLMLSNPKTYEKLKAEVRAAFKSSSGKDVTVEGVGRLPYLSAILKEAMRIMPPVPAGFVRQVPAEGGEIPGYYRLPGNCNVSVSVSQYPAYNSPLNFKEADKFAPERWMGDEEYKDDNQDIHQPFSFGPRNCIGKNLAYAEVRLILVKMVLAFDMELAPESKDWFDRCLVRTLWAKPALLVKLTARAD